MCLGSITGSCCPKQLKHTHQLECLMRFVGSLVSQLGRLLLLEVSFLKMLFLLIFLFLYCFDPQVYIFAVLPTSNERKKKAV